MTTPSSGRGAVPTGDDRDHASTRPGWLIPLLAVLAVLLVGLLLWLLLRDAGDDDELDVAASPSVSPTVTPLPSETPTASDIATPSPTAQASPTDTATTATTATSPAPAAPADDEDIALTAGTEEVFPLPSPDQDLSTFTGEVVGRSVPVESVPADQGFWLGTGPDQRIWVEIVAIEGETPFTVRRGEQVSFTGAEFVPHDETYAQRLGVSADEGADQLTAQGAHVQVRASDMQAG